MLKGKSAIITGSTSGIGWGIAKELARNGANIMLDGFADEATAEKLKFAISSFGVQVDFHAYDVSKADQVDQLFDDTLKDWGSVDIVINNVGIQHVAPVDEFPPEKWDAILACNLSSAFYMTRRAVPLMKSKGWGRIINISSVHGLVASVNKVGYVAAKHGLIGMTKVVALEMAGSGITCNAICPGWVHTPLVQAQIDAIAKRDNLSNDEATTKLLSEKQPSKQFAAPEDVGALAAFLCTDSAKQITGASYTIDGGWTVP